MNEYVLATVSSYILGNSIEQFSIVIALMMLMMGFAGWIQIKTSDSYLLEKFILIEVLIALVGGFAPITIYAAFSHVSEHFLVIHYSFVMLIGFLIGFEVPIVMRIINTYGVAIKYNLAAVYAMDYIGAFVGAMLWVKILLKIFPLTEISFIVAGLNFAIALLTCLYFIRLKIIRQRVLILFILFITTFLLIYGYLNNRDWNLRLEQKFYDDPITEVVNSQYQHIVLTENKKTNDKRLYINGNTQFSSLDERRYHELLVHPAMAQFKEQPKHAIILGGGDGLALRELLKYQELEKIWLIDLDMKMINFAKTHPVMKKLNQNAFDNSRVHITKISALQTLARKNIYLDTKDQSARTSFKPEAVASVDVWQIDAYHFFRQFKGIRWDVVIIDFPDPASVELSKLYSKQFYMMLKKHLAPQAIIALQATSPYHSQEAFLTIKRTLIAAGYQTQAYHQNIPSLGDWGFYLAWPQNQLLADQQPTGQQPNKQIIIPKQFNDTTYLTPELFKASMVFGKNELKSKGHCINTLMHPCLMYDYLDKGWVID